MATKKAASKKRGSYKKKTTPEGEGQASSGVDDQEPLDRFRQGAAASMGKEEGAATGDETDNVVDANELIDEEASGQRRIPGQERKGNKKIEKQALKVRELQQQRQDILEEEIA